jgi:hypothetical protein
MTAVAEIERTVDALKARAIVDLVDVAALERPAALRSVVRQCLARLSVRLHDAPRARRAVVVVWTGERRLSPRERALVLGAAESMHARHEMTRGMPLGLAFVCVDSAISLGRLDDSLEAGSVPEGVALLDGADVCRQGLRSAVMASRI